MKVTCKVVKLEERHLKPLNELVKYQDGEIVSKLNGRVYGSKTKAGYLECSIKIGSEKVRCYLHRLVFLLYRGYLPEYIDHKDGDKQNNLISNLREVSQLENGHNCKKSKNNKSGFNGVYYDKERDKWSACIKINYHKVGFQRFNNKVCAILHRLQLEEEYKDVIKKPL